MSVAVRVSAAVVLALVAWLSVLALSPPDVPGTALSTDFSATRALEAVAPIVESPRPTGAPEHDRAAERLVAQLQALGLEVVVQQATACAHAVDWVHCAHVRDVVARLRGSEGSQAVALVAHYDSVPNAPGAADDGSGVATLLETARALKEGNPLRNDVILIFDDAEEDGLLGAVAFTRDPPWGKSIRVVLNFDARGARGGSTMFDASADDGVLVAALAGTPHPVSNSLVSSLAGVLPNDTDGTIFKSAGYATMSFAFIDGFEHYHRATDSQDTLDPRSVQHQGSYALSLARRLGNADLTETRAPSPVYFDVFGQIIVAYPPWVGSVLTALAGVLLLAALVRAGVGKQVSVAGFALGFGLPLLALLGSVAASAGLSWLVLLLAPRLPLVAHGGIALAPHVALVAAVCVALTGWTRGSRTPIELALGSLTLWILGAVATAVWAPRAGFLFHVPAVVAAAALLVASGKIPETARFLLVCAGAIPLVYLMALLSFSLLLMAGGAMPTVAAASVAVLLAMLVGPISWCLPGASARHGAAFLAVSSLLLAGITVLVARSDRTTPRPDSIGYALDADSGQALWVSDDRQPDAATRPLLGDSPRRSELLAVDPWAGQVLSAPAPSLPLAPPEVRVVHDVADGAKRTLSLRVVSPRGARCITLWEASGARVRSVRVDGLEPFPIVRFSPETDKRLWHAMAGAPPHDFWSVVLCAPGPGFDVDLEVDPQVRLELHAVDVTAGLPAGTPGVDRPPSVIPSQWSDDTRVAKRFDVCSPSPCR
ncbi:MAG TPA: M28 family peptidase [Polyangiaceae bacterium]